MKIPSLLSKLDIGESITKSAPVLFMPATRMKQSSATRTISTRDGGCRSIGKAAPRTHRRSDLPATLHRTFSSIPRCTLTMVRVTTSWDTSFSLTHFISGAAKKTLRLLRHVRARENNGAREFNASTESDQRRSAYVSPEE